MVSLPKKARIYIVIVIMCSLLLLLFMFNNYTIPSIQALLFWSILSIVAESLAISLASNAVISVGLAISLATLIVGGPLTAAIASGLGFMFRVVKLRDRGYVHLLNAPLYKTVFNVSQSILVAGLSGILYSHVYDLLYIQGATLPIISIAVALIAHPTINTAILSTLFSLLREEPFMKVWLTNIQGVYVSALAVGTLGVIIALAYISYGPGAVLLFFGPLLLARYSFKLYMDMRNVYMETVEALTKTLEAKDPYTSGHASRVEEYSVRLAIAMGLPENKINNIKTAALLHDIGKIGIDDNILKKPGKLTEMEYRAIQRHPLIGAQILKDVDYLKEVVEIIKSHHERFDGKGYPDGIKGKEIPMEAAILSIADVYDAMTSDRPYRPALTREQAISEIETNIGTQFNPNAARVFVSFMKEQIQEELLTNAN